MPEDIILYTVAITLFFYLFIHVAIMNFIDIKPFEVSFFDKKEHEEVSEYFISKLDLREKRMDTLLLEVKKMNIKHELEQKMKKQEVNARKKRTAHDSALLF